jgi:hypothetical protein
MKNEKLWIVFVIICAVAVFVFFLYKTFLDQFNGLLGKKETPNSVLETPYELSRTGLATSSDNKILALYKDIRIGQINQGELWAVNLKNGQEELLAKEGEALPQGIVNVSDVPNPPLEIANIKAATFSSDNKTLYFWDSLAYMVSGAVYSVDLSSKAINFIGGSNYLDVIKKGKYKDYLVLYKHEYMPAGGSYDYYYVVDPKNGDEVRAIGSSLHNLNDFSWEDLLMNLSVPDKYSDLCGFMANNCKGFNFINGELPNNLKNNIHGEITEPGNADIILNIPKAISGTLNIDNREINIIVAPYSWSWASSGYGVYIIKNTDGKLEVISRIDFGKQSPDLLSIYDNSIYINSFGEDKTYSKICHFENGRLSEESLVCETSK